jgi:ubiquinone/menaquinone biosynthesis C-methylase UbiE
MTNKDVLAMAMDGFAKAASMYEGNRPSYPNEAIEHIKSLSINPTIIVDLGAGTGILTRLLSTIGAQQIIAVEPVSSMREKLQLIPSITQILDGTGEHIPLEDNTVDIITCGQSFHWFATDQAVAEMHRILKPNGILALVWNVRDDEQLEWGKQIQTIAVRHSAEAPLYKTMHWKKAFDKQTLFSPLEHQEFHYVQRATRDKIVNITLATSYIVVLPDDRKVQIEKEIRQILDDSEELRDQQEFDTPYVTHVYWCTKN